MSEEVADNVAPVEENVAPVQEETTVQETTEQKTIEKFGELLSYASDDVKEAKTWEKFKDVDIPTALKAIVDMDKWTGKRGDIPQDGATDDEWKAFYEKIGVPADEAGYEYAFDDELKSALGDEAGNLENYVGEMKKLALKHKIPAKAMDSFLADAMQYEMTLRGNAAESSKEAREAALADLQKEWGDGKEFDEMAQAVINLEKHYGLSEEEMDQVEASPLFNKVLGRIAKDLDEKGQVGNVFSQTQIGVKDELSDVEGQIREVLSTNGRNVNDPKLNTLLERRDRLQAKLA